jgi:hypothetical protein
MEGDEMKEEEGIQRAKTIEEQMEQKTENRKRDEQTK